MRPVIFDVDGVLADFILGFTTLAAKLGWPGMPYSTHVQETWDFPWKTSEVWDAVKKDPSWWITLVPLATSGEFMQIWGLERPIYFVTSRVGIRPEWQTRRWLEDHMIYRPTVIVSSQKGEIAKAVDAEYLIDDKAGNAVYAAYESPRTTCYLIDRLYNRFDPAVLGSAVRRVKTVTEFLDDVENNR